MALSVLALAAAGPLVAAGMDEPAPQPTVPAPVVQPAPPATGGDWTGFYAGVQLGYGQIDDQNDPTVFDDEFNGQTYGIHAGYLYDFGNIVAGFELDTEQTNIEEETLGLDIDNLSRAKVRVGYDAGRVLPYLTGGAVWASTSGFADLDDNGRFLGVGIDYQATPNIRVGGEVLKHRFEDFDNTGIDFDATTASVRVSFTF